MKDYRIAKGVIKKIFHMNCYTFPFNLDDMLAVAYKTNNIELITTEDSNFELDNSKLKEMFEKSKLDVELISHSNILVGLNYTMEITNGLNLDNIDENLLNSASKIKIEFVTYTLNKQNAKFLCVYLNQNELKNNNVSRMIYNFDDIIKVVLNNPEKYYGIIVNPESEMFIISNKSLIRYKYEKLMTNANKMRELLSQLKPKEIAYIGQYNYEKICKVYFDKVNPKKLAIEFNKSEKEIGDILDCGYKALIHIVIDNY